MFCTKCGNELPEGAVFCVACGARVADRGPEEPQVATLVPAAEAKGNNTGLNPRLLGILAVAVVVAIALIVVFAVRPAMNEGSQSSGPASESEHVEGDNPGETSTQPARESFDAVDDPSASEAASSNDSGALPGGESAAAAAAPDPSSYDVATKDFAFNIPEYWKGKVEWKTWEEDGYSHAVVYPKVALGYVEGYFLVNVHAGDPSAPRSAGDHIYHKIATLEEAGKSVDVRSKNWPVSYAEFFYSNPDYTGSSQENELMSALIDLCCGGKELPDVREQARNASNPGEASKVYGIPDADFLTVEFVPNVVVMPSQPSGQEGQRGQGAEAAEPVDYAARAQEISSALFTNAADQGGLMVWTGSDVSDLVAPDGDTSDASAARQLENLRSNSYCAIAKQTELLENDGERRKFRVRVVYEKNLSADGSNRQANIAEVGLWLNEEGLAQRITVNFL